MMMQNLILLTVSGFVFAAYLLFVIIKFGVLNTISDSYYLVKIPLLFTSVLSIGSFLIMIVANTTLMIISGLFICAVAFAPEFREKLEGIIHVTFATLGIFAAMTSIALEFKMWYLSIGFAVFYFLITKVIKIKHPTYWTEVAALVTVFAVLFISRVLSPV